MNLKASVLLGAAVLLAPKAHAGVTLDTSLTAVPGGNGFQSVTLPTTDIGATNFVLPDPTDPITVTMDNIPQGQGVVEGSSAGKYAAPITNSQGTAYTTPYFSTGNTTGTGPGGTNGYINLSFTNPEQSLALLWGSVDASNLISFYNGTTLVASVTGQNVCTAAGISCGGSQAFGGSVYVLINSTLSFNDIELSSGITSFESAEYEVNPQQYTPTVPEPATIGVFALALAALASIRRRNAQA